MVLGIEFGFWVTEENDTCLMQSTSSALGLSLFTPHPTLTIAPKNPCPHLTKETIPHYIKCLFFVADHGRISSLKLAIITIISLVTKSREFRSDSAALFWIWVSNEVADSGWSHRDGLIQVHTLPKLRQPRTWNGQASQFCFSLFLFFFHMGPSVLCLKTSKADASRWLAFFFF